MSKTIVVFTVFLFNICNANASQFCFQKQIAEGQVDIYKIEIDHINKNGKLCFINTEDFDKNVSDDLINKIRDGNIWSSISNFSNQKWGCGEFHIYSYGWFKVEPIVIHDGEIVFMFFYAGEINNLGLEGVLYQFRDFIPSGEDKIFRSIDKLNLTTSKKFNCNNIDPH